MSGHAPAGADTVAGIAGGVTLGVVCIVAMAAVLWFLWPTLRGEPA